MATGQVPSVVNSWVVDGSYMAKLVFLIEKLECLLAAASQGRR